MALSIKDICFILLWSGIHFATGFSFILLKQRKIAMEKGETAHVQYTKGRRSQVLSNHNDGYNLQHPQSNTTAGGHDNKKIAVSLAVCNRLPQRVQFNSRGNSGIIITPQPGRNSENVELTRSNTSYANH